MLFKIIQMVFESHDISNYVIFDVPTLDDNYVLAVNVINTQG